MTSQGRHHKLHFPNFPTVLKAILRWSNYHSSIGVISNVRSVNSNPKGELISDLKVNNHPSGGIISVWSVNVNPTGELISNMSVNYHPSSEVFSVQTVNVNPCTGELFSNMSVNFYPSSEVFSVQSLKLKNARILSSRLKVL